MRWHRSFSPATLIFFLFLIVPGVVLAYFLHSGGWAIVWPVGIIVLMLALAALPTKRKVTPQQFADELERHLLGTEGPWDWDDTTSVRIADERLERLRLTLSKYDRLALEEDREELRKIIVALRRGEIPEIG